MAKKRQAARTKRRKRGAPSESAQPSEIRLKAASAASKAPVRGDGESRDSRQRQTAAQGTEQVQRTAPTPVWRRLQAYSERYPQRTLLMCAALLAFLFTGWLLFTNDPFVGNATDMISSKHPKRQFLHDQIMRGSLPLWDPNIVGGVPYAAGVPGYLTPNVYLTAIFEPVFGVHLSIVLHTALTAMGAAWWASRHTRGMAPPLLAAAVFSLSGFYLAHLWAGHLRMLMAVAYIPWLAGCVERAIEKAPRGIATATVVCGLMLLTGHFAINYIALWGLGLYLTLTALLESEPGHRLKTALKSVTVLSVVVAVGLCLCAVILWPGLETVELSQRGEPNLEFNASYPSAPANMLSLIWPHFYGNSIDERFIGDWSMHEGLPYFGVAALAMVLLAPQRLGLRRSAPALLVMLFGLVMSVALATPVFEWFLEIAPQARSFRSPGRWVLLAVLGASILCARVLDDYQRADDRRAPWGVLLVVVVCAVGGAWVLSMGTEQYAAAVAGVSSDRALQYLSAKGYETILALAQSEVKRSLLVAVLALGIVWLGAQRRRRRVAAAALVVLAFVEFAAVGQRFLITGDEEALVWDDRLTDYLKTRAEPGMRVMVDRRLHTSGRLGPLGISEVGGYSSTVSGRYLRLLNAVDRFTLDSYVAYARIRRNGPLLGRLGMRYLLSQRPQPERPYQFSLIGYDDWEYIGRFRDVFLYENPDPQPRAFLTRAAEVLDEPSTLARLKDPSFDLREGATLDEPLPAAFDDAVAGGKPSADDRVQITRYEPNQVEFDVAADGPAMLVLSDNWHPGWHATVDGQEVPVVQVNYFMRAVPVPSGAHHVRMHFLPAGFPKGALLSGLCLACVIGFGVWARRRKPSAQTDVAQTEPESERSESSPEPGSVAED